MNTFIVHFLDIYGTTGEMPWRRKKKSCYIRALRFPVFPWQFFHISGFVEQLLKLAYQVFVF
jgi:hypothetical protein